MLKPRNLWKGLALFAALVCFATVSYGQGSVYQNQVFGPTGAPKGGATITVCNNAGNSLATCPGPNNANLAQIFSDQALTLPLANPLTADGLGNFQFFAASGIYYYTVTGAGTTSPGPYIAILYCIPNGSCGLGTQFPWAPTLPSSATPTITVGNGNVNYFMTMTVPVTSVKFTGTPNNGDYLGIDFYNPSGVNITVGAFPSNVQFPASFSFNISPGAGYLLAWTYASISNSWIPTAVWGGGGAGSSFYQTVQQAGVQKPQEPKLNFLSPVTVTDNPGNSSSDITIPLNYQTVQNNASSLPVEPKINLVPPLTAVDNPANTRTDINCPTAIGVGGSHSSGCVPDPGASGATSDYLGRDMAYHSSVSAATVKPVNADAVMWVTAEGSDISGDGLSFGSAFLTIYHAICSLPGGNCGTQTAGTGTVYVTTGVSANTSVSNGGIWLMGCGGASPDPNCGSVPSGWLKCTQSGQSCNLHIVGMANFSGGPNAHKPTVNVTAGGGSDTNHPAVWLSSVGQVWIENIHSQYPGRAVVVGECSNNTRTGTCAVTGSTFENDSFLLNQIAGNGPCTDITGASFWVWFRDYGCGGNAYTATGGRFSNAAAAMLIDGTSNAGNGLIQVQESNFAGGGIKVIPGTNGAGLYADNVTEEGDFVHDIPAAVWFTSFPAQTDCKVSNIQIADPGPSGAPAVQNDGGSPGCTVLNTLNGIVQGPNVVINQDNRNVQSATTVPISSGQVGFFNGYMVGQTDVARRLAGLAPARFSNNATNNSGVWTFSDSPTVATGQSDPYGGTGATKITTTNASFQTAQLASSCVSSPGIGGWVVVGVWVQGMSPTQATVTPTCFGVSSPTYSTQISGVGMQIGNSADWQFRWVAGKVSSGGVTSVSIDALYSNTVIPTLYGPVMYVIAPGALSDNEVLTFASTMNSVDGACRVGTVCNITGHPVSADVFQERSVAAPTGAANVTMHYMDSSALWPSFKPNGNTAYIVPGFTGTWTAGQCATATATTNVFNLGTCGSGSGTITPSQQFNLTYYSGAGSSSTINGATAPTTFAEPYFWVTIPSGGVATAPQAALPGVPGRTTASATDTVLVTDRVNRVEYTNAGAVTVTLPAAGSAGFSNNMAFQAKSRGAGSVVTFNQGAGNCNGGGAGTCVLKQGQVGTFKTVDNTNWFMDAHEPPISCGTNLVCTRSDYGLTLSSTAGGGTVTATGASLPNGQLVVGNVYPDVKPADLSGDCSTSGTTAVTCTRLNGGSFSGTNGDLVSFGVANIPADSGVVAANAVTAGSNFTTGDLVQAAGNNKTTSDSGVIAANVVTNSTGNAAAANQVIVSGGANKTAKAIDFPDVHEIPAANCNNTSAGAGWSIGAGGAVLCRAGTNNKGGYIQITDTAATFATFQIHIPKDWDTGSNPFISFDISSTDATSGHTIIPSVQVACYKGDGSTTDDIAPQAAHSLSTITLNTTTNQFWSTSNVQLSNTDMTGCSGGSLMQVTVGRATDTATNAQFYAATMTFPRLLVVQAN